MGGTVVGGTVVVTTVGGITGRLTWPIEFPNLYATSAKLLTSSSASAFGSAPTCITWVTNDVCVLIRLKVPSLISVTNRYFPSDVKTDAAGWLPTVIVVVFVSSSRSWFATSTKPARITEPNSDCEIHIVSPSASTAIPSGPPGTLIVDKIAPPIVEIRYTTSAMSLVTKSCVPVLFIARADGLLGTLARLDTEPVAVMTRRTLLLSGSKK